MNFVFCGLDLYFQGPNFQLAILTCTSWKMQTLLLQSDRKLAICHRMSPLRMLYILSLAYIFKVTNFVMWISRKLRKQAKQAEIWLYISSYLSSNGVSVSVVHCVVHRDLDLNFQDHTFETLISWKWRAITKMCLIGLLQKLIFTIKWHNCECCTPWPWTSFARTIWIRYKNNGWTNGCTSDLYQIDKSRRNWTNLPKKSASFYPKNHPL